MARPRPGVESRSSLATMAAISTATITAISATRPTCSTLADPACAGLLPSMARRYGPAARGMRVESKALGSTFGPVCFHVPMEGSPFNFFGDPDEFRNRMEELSEQMQSSQRVAWADNAIKLAVEMTVASLGQIELTGDSDAQVMQV